MSVQNKGHSTMGLPRASGKRRWSGEEDADAVPAKVICTSPPHALCAEDVLHHPALTHAHASTPALECELTSSSTPVETDETSQEVVTSTAELLAEEEHNESSSSSASFETSAPTSVLQEDTTNAFTDSEDSSSADDDEHDDFIDDEEDKDSGFIDSNSIDNSSDDEMDSSSARVLSSSEPSVPTSSSASDDAQCITVSSSCSTTTTTTTAASSSSLQLSLSRVLPPHPSTALSISSSETTALLMPLPSSPSPTSFSMASVTPPTEETPLDSPMPPSLASDEDTLLGSPTITSSSSTTTTMTTTTTTIIASDSEVDGVPTVSMVSDGSVTTVTAAQTGTVVTSAYQGTLTSPAYDPHSYPYPPESYPARPATPAWGSCNFYDGSQPTTNKYMEISPSKSSANQSIQCDENGKSYLELGSASPYTHTYSSECGNYTTSPSSYPSQSYNQTCTSPSNSSSTYGQPNSYFNSRQSYSPSPYNVYPASDGYGNFENENGCGYGYGANGYAGARGTLPPSRGPPRCMSPYCDPTRGAARPNCYHQQRLSVLNMSMYKLNRFRQFPEPSLHRSVLICNTLRHIERELEAEGVSVASLLAHSHAHTTNPHLQGAAPNQGVQTCPEPMPSSPTPSPPPTEGGPLPPMHAPLVGSPLAAPVSLPPSTPSTPPPPVSHYSTASPVQYPTSQYLPADHPTTFDGRETAHLRQYQSLPPDDSHTDDEGGQGPSSEADTEEAEPEEPPPSPSSTRPPTMPSEERTDAINWCSVLSLSSQTDLDSMNNNEYGDWGGESSSDMDYGRTDDGPPWKLPSLSAEDVLKSFPEASKRLEANEDLDSIINVLVGS